MFSKVFPDPSCGVISTTFAVVSKNVAGLGFIPEVGQLPCTLYPLPLNSSIEVLGREIAK